ncbi:MAG: restriction endonuclease subunit S, partial [Staphylococcus sp.]|nr:restriction endonuclease subunit S [Staphylococcus sp.]
VGDYKKGPFGSAITIDMFIEKSPGSYKVYEQKNAIRGNCEIGEAYIPKSVYNNLKNFSVYPLDIIVSCAGTIGKCYILPEDCEQGIINQALMRVRVNKSFNLEYFLYIFDIVLSYAAIKYSNGSAIKNIPPFNVLNKLRVTLPSNIEQLQIVNYLDKKTALLDKAKALLEEQIQKLKDYRASLIYETVTKGLDQTVPMKDSGIDWIGQVPQGWGVKPIKHVVATPVTDGPHETPLLCETGIPFLSAEAVKNGVLDFNYKRGYISLQDHERFKKKISPKKDDIFIVKSGATTGNVGIVNTDEIFDIWSPLALIRCKKSLAVQKYIYYYLISNIFKAQVEFNWSFGTQQNIGMGIIENIKLILPPLSEQTKISDLLDKKTYQIDQLIQIKNKQIDNINKQRQTLIYDFVTGKRRV